ncbi:MAG: prepilin-type N-terminal cleavage/methylation domain-containing protein [Phycisphaerae bacterium]|nr:prepilin-type N-terminal cleavage/methylation domain-containing protein [Phycisphaerae bacterium]NUQ45557.1 prepilin-type N-terminal cleavage/methylation domain-containing protein [Phycisphaerae bacterium]
MKKRAFTLVELLIVVIILGILAAIVVPQFTEASSDAQMNSLMSNLRVIRGQIELYKLQHNGTYPELATFTTQMTQKTNPDGTTTGTPTLGPYLQRIPTNPFSNTNDVTNTAVGSSKAWYYNETTGEFKANDSAAHAAL